MMKVSFIYEIVLINKKIYQYALHTQIKLKRLVQMYTTQRQTNTGAPQKNQF